MGEKQIVTSLKLIYERTYQTYRLKNYNPAQLRRFMKKLSSLKIYTWVNLNEYFEFETSIETYATNKDLRLAEVESYEIPDLCVSEELCACEEKIEKSTKKTTKKSKKGEK